MSETGILEENAEKEVKKEIAKEVNADPLTGAHGSHPVGTGIGATATRRRGGVR